MAKEIEYQDSLWNRCFWEVFETMKKRGATDIQFADVDRLVIEKSRMNVEELIKYIKGTSS